MFAREVRTFRSVPRGETLRRVGDFEFGYGAPQAFEIVVTARLIAKDVHDEAAKIEQRPFSGAMPLAVFGRPPEIFVQPFFDFRADSLYLRRAIAGTDHEVIREGAGASEFEHGDGSGFLFLCGFNSQSDTLRQRFEFHRYRPCLRMYSSTREETSP